MWLVFVFFYARTRICKIEILSSTHLFIVAPIPSTSSCPQAPSTIGTSSKSRRRYRHRVIMWLVFVFFYARTRIRKIEILSSTHHCRIHILSSISSRLQAPPTIVRVLNKLRGRGVVTWDQVRRPNYRKFMHDICMSTNSIFLPCQIKTYRQLMSSLLHASISYCPQTPRCSPYFYTTGGVTQIF